MSAHCPGSDRLIGDSLECFGHLYCCFSLPRGNKGGCMMHVGWEEFGRMTTRGLGKVRAVFRMNFEMVPMLIPVEDDI